MSNELRYYKYKMLVELYRLSDQFTARHVAQIMGVKKSALYNKLARPKTFCMDEVLRLLAALEPFHIDFYTLKDWMYWDEETRQTL